MSDAAYNIIRGTLDSVPCPVRGVVIDIVEFTPSMFAYRIYQENLSEFSDADGQLIGEYIIERAELAERLSGKVVGIEKLQELPHE